MVKQFHDTPPRPEVAELMDKFKDTYQIVEMLKHFEGKHTNINISLSTSNEGHRCTAWKTEKISVQDIVDYIYDKEGLSL